MDRGQFELGARFNSDSFDATAEQTKPLRSLR
jgi:hypothetical protein